MARLTVPCVTINEQQRDTILNYGFNPPGSAVDPELFQKEIRQLCDQFNERLSQHWKYGIGDGDYFIHTDSEIDRMLCVEITEGRMINEDLLPVAHRAVADLAEDYCVDFCNARLYLKTEAGEEHPDFNIFVSKSLISIFTESEYLLKRLGVSESPL